MCDTNTPVTRNNTVMS